MKHLEKFLTHINSQLILAVTIYNKMYLGLKAPVLCC